MPSEAVILDPVTEKAWMSAALNEWTEAVCVGGREIKHRKPTPMTVYSHSEVSKLLRVPRGELGKALAAHQLVPEALTMDPAEQAWQEQALCDRDGWRR